MKKIGALVLVLLILLSTVSVAFAAGPDGDEGEDIELVPQPAVDSTSELESGKYPITRYTFDSKKFGMIDILASGFKWLTNLLFFVNVLIAKLANFLLVEGFTLNIFDLIGDMFNSIVDALQDAIFMPLLSMVLPIAAVAIVFFAAVNKSTKSTSLIISVIIILALAGAFMASPSLVITMVNDASSELSTGALAATATVVQGRATSGGDAVAHLSNIYWDTTVSNPWQIIQFGKIKGESYVEEYLSKKSGSDERNNLAKDSTNFLFSEMGQIIRFAIALFVLIINLIMSVMIIALAGLMFISQFAAIIASIIAVLGFIISLLPNMGVRVAVSAIFNVFEFILARLGITLLLCVYFVISAVLYKAIGEIGWFLVMILQLALIITIILYRKKIFGFVYAAKSGQQAAINNIQKERDKNSISKAMLKGYGYAKVGQDVLAMNQKRVDNKLEKRYKPVAEQYLYKRYAEDKAVAEKEAAKTGKDPQYSDFVRKVDQRVDMGHKPFSLDDIQKTTNMMKKIHKQGEDPERLVMTDVAGKPRQQIKNDQYNLETTLKHYETELRDREFKNEKAIDENIRKDPRSMFYNRRQALQSKLQRGAEKAELFTNGVKSEIREKVNVAKEVPLDLLKKAITRENNPESYWEGTNNTPVEESGTQEEIQVQPITADGTAATSKNDDQKKDKPADHKQAGARSAEPRSGNGASVSEFAAAADRLNKGDGEQSISEQRAHQHESNVVKIEKEGAAAPTKSPDLKVVKTADNRERTINNETAVNGDKASHIKETVNNKTTKEGAVHEMSTKETNHITREDVKNQVVNETKEIDNTNRTTTNENLTKGDKVNQVNESVKNTAVKEGTSHEVTNKEIQNTTKEDVKHQVTNEVREVNSTERTVNNENVVKGDKVSQTNETVRNTTVKEGTIHETNNKETTHTTQEQTRHETVNKEVNNTTAEKINVVNVENVTENQRKEISRTFNNIEDRTVETNEKIEEKTTNTANIREVQNIERVQDIQNLQNYDVRQEESPRITRDRSEILRKARSFDKNNEK